MAPSRPTPTSTPDVRWRRRQWRNGVALIASCYIDDSEEGDQRRMERGPDCMVLHLRHHPGEDGEGGNSCKQQTCNGRLLFFWLLVNQAVSFPMFIFRVCTLCGTAFMSRLLAARNLVKTALFKDTHMRSRLGPGGFAVCLGRV